MNASVASTSTKKSAPAVPHKADGGKDAATRIVFVYGTLKRGFYNNEYWFADAKFLGDDKISGYVMLNLGPYPAIAKIDLAEAREHFGVTGELWEVPEDAYLGVKRMEEGAGYTAVPTVTDGGLHVDVFIMHNFAAGNYTWATKPGKKRDSEVVVTKRDQVPF
jgi:gamma-glutamylcyclotransferase (GGCT)/AIG2-like uncharacterized protein YtfP